LFGLSSIVHDGDIAFLDTGRAAFRAARRSMKDVLAPAPTVPGNPLDTTLVLFFRYGFDIHLFSYVLVVLGSGNTAGARQALEIAKVEFAKPVKPDGLRSPALITAQKVEDESSTVVHREDMAAIQTLRIHLISHFRLLCDR
jgi:hypothetical protein